MASRGGLFPALLRHWRNRRGLSQLDLALNADVSARHVSFLETGRAQPSREMVLRLTAALRVPLRDRNTMLIAAGFEEVFGEPELQSGLTPAVRNAIEHMLVHHEPYPMTVLDRHYTVRLANQAALRVLAKFVAEPARLQPPLNAFRLLFDPQLGRTFVQDWPRTARGFLSRLHIEALEHPSDTGLAQLIDELLAYPDVPDTWRQPDFSQPLDSTLNLLLTRGNLSIGFITTMTMFSAPGNVTLDELRIESYFPIDSATEAFCQRVAASP